MQCIRCCKVMDKQKTRFNFQGNFDMRYTCQCGINCIEQVRYAQLWNRVWTDKDGGVLEVERTASRHTR